MLLTVYLLCGRRHRFGPFRASLENLWTILMAVPIVARRKAQGLFLIFFWLHGKNCFAKLSDFHALTLKDPTLACPVFPLVRNSGQYELPWAFQGSSLFCGAIFLKPIPEVHDVVRRRYGRRRPFPPTGPCGSRPTRRVT